LRPRIIANDIVMGNAEWGQGVLLNENFIRILKR